MRPSAKLISLATAVPPNVLSQSDVATAANQCFGGRYDKFERLARVFKSPGRRCHVNSDVTGGHVDRLHDVALRQLQAPSVSACDHRACGVGILSLPAEPSPCRGDAARARHCRLLRDGAAVGDEVPARLCPPPQAQESEPPRYLAHLGEVVIIIGVKQHWLWRAVDQNGYIIDEIVQTRRDTKAAKRLLTRLLKKQGCPPRRMITDKLGSYAAARRQIMPAIEHRCTRPQQPGRELSPASATT